MIKFRTRKHRNFLLLIIVLLVLISGCDNNIGSTVLTDQSTHSTKITDTNDLAAKIKQGNGFLEAKLFNEAVICYKEILDVDPKYADAYIGLADAYIGLHDSTNAEDTLRAGVVAVPDASCLYLKLAELYGSIRKSDDAARILQYGYSLTKSEDILKVIMQYESMVGNSPGNLKNMAFIAQKDGWIYYRNDSDKYSLYKMKDDGSIKEKLDESVPQFINVVGDWIYYMDARSLKNYKIRTDGTDRTPIPYAFKIIAVIGEWIYYTDREQSSISRMRSDFSEVATITDSFQDACIVNGWIYFVDENSILYKIYEDGSDKTLLRNEFFGDIQVYDGWIYGIGPDYDLNETANSLYIVRTDGNEFSKLVENVEMSLINIADGWIYYTRQSENDGEIRAMRTDATEDHKLISCQKNTYINIIDGWIYYESPREPILRKVRIDGSDAQVVD